MLNNTGWVLVPTEIYKQAMTILVGATLGEFRMLGGHIGESVAQNVIL